MIGTDGIIPDHTPAELISMERNRSMHFDNPHTIEIEVNGLRSVWAMMSSQFC